MGDPAKDQYGRVQSASGPWSLWMAVMDIYFAKVHILALSIQREVLSVHQSIL